LTAVTAPEQDSALLDKRIEALEAETAEMQERLDILKHNNMNCLQEKNRPVRMTKILGESYSPIYFLNALGAGGLAVSFFMYLMWMTPHKGSPIPTFATLTETFAQGGALMRTLIAVGASGVAIFTFLHVRLLVWNLRNYAVWKKTPAYAALRGGNAETQLMAIPLTLAMTVNAAFIVGAVFVPGLWAGREYLFPLALLGFTTTGVYGLRLYLAFLGRVLTEGGYDCAKSNNLGQMISVLALSMTAVGFSAAAAMSQEKAIVTIAFVGAVFFTAAAIVLGVIKLVLGFRAMMEYKAAAETTPTLWIIIPILTVLGIAIYRLKMSLIHSFGVKEEPGSLFAFLAFVLAVQLFFGLIGWAVMRRVGYFEKWVDGPEMSPGSYALICPGVALFVFGNFFINAGLVRIGALEAMSTVYWILYLPLIAVQILTIKILLRLNAKLFAPEEPVVPL
jgi:hypothetical protein